MLKIFGADALKWVGIQWAVTCVSDSGRVCKGVQLGYLPT
jgi:hypothetical protein